MPSAVTVPARVDQSDSKEVADNSGEEAKGRCITSVKCQECGEREAKYRCPGCGLRSCGLHCVKSHKERTQCTGKRKRTLFVPVSEYDDNVLISDYNLLEETLRQADAAKRFRTPLGCVKSEVHPSMKSLQRQAKNRATTLLFVAHGMSRRKANKSIYDRKTKRIFWTVEWTFDGTDVRITDARVDENLSLESILVKHLTGNKDVIVKHRLRNFSWKPLHELKLLLRKEHCSAAEPVFYELNLTEGLREQLAQKCIIEYPIIHVVLRDFRKYTILSNLKPLANIVNEDQSDGQIIPTPQEPDRIPFREEEIEEGEFVP